MEGFTCGSTQGYHAAFIRPIQPLQRVRTSVQETTRCDQGTYPHIPDHKAWLACGVLADMYEVTNRTAEAVSSDPTVEDTGTQVESARYHGSFSRCIVVQDSLGVQGAQQYRCFEARSELGITSA